MNRVTFDNNIIILGFGSITKSVLPLIAEHFDLVKGRLKILSKEEPDKDLVARYNAEYITQELTKDNYTAALEREVTAGDLIVNLTAGVNSIDLARYASNNNILYIDTCIEMWPEEVNPDSKTHDDRQIFLDLQSELTHNHTTSLTSMGANPGIVSLLTKRLMLTIAKDVGLDIPKPQTQLDWANLAEKLTVRTIHINERDTQFTNDEVGDNDFICTWSIEAMAIESIEPSEMSVGSHERELPIDATFSDISGHNKRDIYFDKSGKDVVISTWLPLTGEQTGMVLNHNEPMSISQLYSKQNGDSLYSPTVCFVYHPCEQTMKSLKNLTETNYDKLDGKLALHDIIDGYDELGVYIMTEEYDSYWLGSRLDIHTARTINPESSATTLQVAGGVIAGMSWIVKNADKGLIEPEDIEDYDYLLNIADKYWGGFVYQKSNWLPGGDNPDSTLQFSSFRQ